MTDAKVKLNYAHSASGDEGWRSGVEQKTGLLLQDMGRKTSAQGEEYDRQGRLSCLKACGGVVDFGSL